MISVPNCFMILEEITSSLTSNYWYIRLRNRDSTAASTSISGSSPNEKSFLLVTVSIIKRATSKETRPGHGFIIISAACSSFRGRKANLCCFNEGIFVV